MHVFGMATEEKCETKKKELTPAFKSILRQLNHFEAPEVTFT